MHPLPPDRLLPCSDGLSKRPADAEIKPALQQDGDALLRKARDNVAAIVVETDEDPSGYRKRPSAQPFFARWASGMTNTWSARP